MGFSAFLGGTVMSTFIVQAKDLYFEEEKYSHFDENFYSGFGIIKYFC